MGVAEVNGIRGLKLHLYAVKPRSLANTAKMTQAFPDRAFSGIGGISDFSQALSYFLLGCGTVQVCTSAMLDQAVGPNIIKRLNAGLDAFLEKHGADGWKTVEDFRGARRDRVVLQSEIRRPDASEYQGGYGPGSYGGRSSTVIRPDGDGNVIIEGEYHGR